MKSQEDSKNLKKVVGLAAADLVKDGMTVGIGTGSTAAFFIEELGRRVKEGLIIRGVPTSYQAKLMCYKYGIPLLDPSLVDRLDIAIDGADEIDYSLNAIKGGGAANTIEKIVAAMADEFVIIADHSKLVERLAVSFPVPVEVIPAALGLVMRKVKEIGARPELRMAVRKAGPVVTDNGNFMVDLYFDEAPDVYWLNRVLKSIPGVVETGLFLGMAHKALIAWEDGVEVMLAAQKG
ncbi:ribose 5-phosphate isomerase A [Caldicoprobacter guelmensis]|uniref:ribose-5-phosphate isomerase RpiA n=1 Tax=Caldicoprobacter guelmensis TaxID=1170224 RepID=UPI001959A414|nr:ribose-5-phosphate isomerase RpiA [Caldicoprobacter guelmensis]MBM7582430.1 ribose 5-phosphate isomerase A [Caldicoprobacter guelmensis]